jgi:hypothetical protein
MDTGKPGDPISPPTSPTGPCFPGVITPNNQTSPKREEGDCARAAGLVPFRSSGKGGAAAGMAILMRVFLGRDVH